MAGELPPGIVALPVTAPLWTRVFTVAPLVLVATRDEHGVDDIAPKHMAIPLGWDSFFCFVCSPRHTTYANAAARGCFTVSYPGPEATLIAGLAASPREPDASKPALAALDTFAATAVDGVLVAGCVLYLECELDRTVDGFGENSLVIGRVVAAAALADAVRDPERDDADVVYARPLLAYLHPGRAATIKETTSFPYPVGFRY